MRPIAPEMRSIFSALVLAALVLAAVPSGFARAEERPLAALEGRWELVDPARQKRIVRREVDRVIDQMSFLVRGIARGRARREIRPPERLVLALSGRDRVDLRFGEKPAQRCRTDGRPRRAPDADAAVSCRVDGDKLVRRSARDDGAQLATLWADPDGETLRVAIRIDSHHLPDTIEYELVYRRAS